MHLGVKEHKINGLESGHLRLTVEWLNKYVDALPELYDFIKIGKKQDKPSNNTLISPVPKETQDGYPIPIYNLHTSAGTGSHLDGEEREGAITLSPTYIRQELGCNPKNLSMLYVTGDSMLPTLQPNDPILMTSLFKPL